MLSDLGPLSRLHAKLESQFAAVNQAFDILLLHVAGDVKVDGAACSPHTGANTSLASARDVKDEGTKQSAEADATDEAKPAAASSSDAQQHHMVSVLRALLAFASFIFQRLYVNYLEAIYSLLDEVELDSPLNDALVAELRRIPNTIQRFHAQYLPGCPVDSRDARSLSRKALLSFAISPDFSDEDKADLARQITQKLGGVAMLLPRVSNLDEMMLRLGCGKLICPDSGAPATPPGPAPPHGDPAATFLSADSLRGGKGGKAHNTPAPLFPRFSKEKLDRVLEKCLHHRRASVTPKAGSEPTSCAATQHHAALQPSEVSHPPRCGTAPHEASVQRDTLHIEVEETLEADDDDLQGVDPELSSLLHFLENYGNFPHECPVRGAHHQVGVPAPTTRLATLEQRDPHAPRSQAGNELLASADSPAFVPREVLQGVRVPRGTNVGDEGSTFAPLQHGVVQAVIKRKRSYYDSTKCRRVESLVSERESAQKQSGEELRYFGGAPRNQFHGAHVAEAPSGSTVAGCATNTTAEGSQPGRIAKESKEQHGEGKPETMERANHDDESFRCELESLGRYPFTGEPDRCTLAESQVVQYGRGPLEWQAQLLPLESSGGVLRSEIEATSLLGVEHSAHCVARMPSDSAQWSTAARPAEDPKTWVFQLSFSIKQVRKRVLDAIAQLNGVVESSSGFCPRATHLIVAAGLTERTEKYLGFCASGKSILSPRYVFDSLRRGRWIVGRDDEYEMNPLRRKRVLSLIAPRHGGGVDIPPDALQQATGRVPGVDDFRLFRGWRVLLLTSAPSVSNGISSILDAGGCVDIIECVVAEDTGDYRMSRRPIRGAGGDGVPQPDCPRIEAPGGSDRGGGSQPPGGLPGRDAPASLVEAATWATHILVQCSVTSTRSTQNYFQLPAWYPVALKEPPPPDTGGAAPRIPAWNKVFSLELIYFTLCTAGCHLFDEHGALLPGVQLAPECFVEHF